MVEVVLGGYVFVMVRTKVVFRRSFFFSFPFVVIKGKFDHTLEVTVLKR